MKLEFPLSILLAIFGSVTTYILGGWGNLLSILTLLIIIDYVTGFIAAGVEGKISSRVGFKGIAQKILIFALVAVAQMLDLLLGTEHMIRDATIFFYIINESVSIIENAGRTGLPIPLFLLKVIEVFRGKIKKK